jgi:hypothetical protein
LAKIGRNLKAAVACQTDEEFDTWFDQTYLGGKHPEFAQTPPRTWVAKAQQKKA